MADEDPREMVRFCSPEPVREERKKATDKEKTKVPSDENKALGQDEESLKQGLSTIWQLSNISACLPWKCSDQFL